MPAMVSPLRVIQLSGYSKSEKKSLIEKITTLGATCHPQPQFHFDCNILVCKSPCRSEKFLCALACGIPIVTTEYVTDSIKVKHWRKPRRYIWQSKPNGERGGSEIYSAPYRMRPCKKSPQKKAFSAWTCAVNVTDTNSCDVYKRILTAGGAKIVDISLHSVNSRRDVPAGLTHLFTENFYKGSCLQIVAENGVRCLSADYMGDFLIKGLEPQPYHYIVPYCPVIDLTNSPYNSESSSIVLPEDHSNNDTDSDIEITSWTSPVRLAGPSRLSYTSLPKSPLAAASHPPSKSSSPVKTGALKSERPDSCVKKSLNGQLDMCAVESDSRRVHDPGPLLVVKNEPMISSISSVSESVLAQSALVQSQVTPNRPSTVTTAACSSQSQPTVLTQRYATALGSVASPSPKKYSKLLLMTPPKLSCSSQQGSPVNNTPAKPTPFFTPTKIKSEPNDPTSSTSSCRVIPSHRKSKKKQVMPPGSLLKYLTAFTPTSKVVTEKIGKDDDSQYSDLSDICPLDDSMSETTAQLSGSVDSIQDSEMLQRNRVLESQSCLGLLEKLTSRLSLAERDKLYKKHEQLKAISAMPVQEEIDLTDNFHAKKLQEMPVVLRKQIRTYFEDDFDNQNLNGLELLNLCTSNIHHPPSQLLQQIYHTLLNTTDRVIAHRHYEYLTTRLDLNPPFKALNEDVLASPSKVCRTRRMRHIYMLSLAHKEHCQRTYLKNLTIAVQTIVSGGLSLDCQSKSPPMNMMDEEDTPLSPMQHTVEDSDSMQEELEEKSSADRDGYLGSRLFILYLHQLLLKDYSTAKTRKDSMLYEICKGGHWTVNFVDSRDTGYLLDSMQRLISVKEIDLACKLLEVVGLLAELCRPDSIMTTDRNIDVIVSRLSGIVKDCDLKEVDGILLGRLPAWLSYKVILSILDDHNKYSNQLISPSAEPLSHPSLQALISRYYFLIPSESIITNRSAEGGVKPEQQPPAPPSSAKQKKNHKGETPLHTACIRGDIDKVRQLLLEPETNVNAADNAGWTALHEACNHCHLQIVELLLTHKSSHFHFDGGGEVDMLAAGGDDCLTPLHDAVNVGAVEVVKLLLRYGGSKLVKAPSKIGTVLDITDNEEILQLLTDALHSADANGNENNSSNGSAEAGIHISPPRSEIYRTHVCTTQKDVIKRYVMYCCKLLSFHVAAFPLNHLDQEILNSLSSHLQYFVDHVQWLGALDVEKPPDFLVNKIRGLLLLSL